MTFSLNSTTLVGTISAYGVKRSKDGKVTCALKLVEEGRGGQVYTSYVHVEVWGTEGAPAAMQMPPGSLVLVQGQLRAKKVKEQWTLVIVARELQLLDRTPEGEYDTAQAG